MSNTVAVNPKQLTQLLTKLIPAREPILIAGPPGVGKSDIVAQVAQDLKYELILSHPAVSDPTDYKGFPFPSKDGTHAEFLPYGELQQMIQTKKPTVCFLDDLGQATPAVQAASMHLLLARQINGHKLSDTVTFMAATNRRSDRAGVGGILEPVKSRFSSILELRTSLDDWIEWALTHKMPPEVVAFLRFRSDLLHDFNPSADISNSPCPRTWAAVGRAMGLGIPSDLEFHVYAGAVGEGAAVELTAFLKLFRQLPDPLQVLKDPEKAIVPTEPSVLFAICGALAAAANPQNFDRVVRYGERLVKASHAEFAVLLMKDSVRRTPALTDSQAFVKMATSPVGKLMRGEVFNG